MTTAQNTQDYSAFSTAASSLNIAIAGGGLLGRLLSWQLLKRGHSVTLFDKDTFSDSRAAAFTAAGMISPFNEVAVSNRLIFQIGMRSITLWEQWLTQLPETLAGLYARKGSLVVAHPQDENELQQLYQELAFHLGGENSAEWVDGQTIGELEPDLGDAFQRGLYLPGEAHLDNCRFLDQLLDTLTELGCRLEGNAEITFADGPKCNGQPLAGFDYFFDCRGFGARESMPAVRGVRGEVLWVQTKDLTLNRPVRLMHPRYKLYIVPRKNNEFILGATEIESDDLSPVSVRSCLELTSALYTLSPAFAEARITKLDVNLRPSLWDNMPHIQCSHCGDGAGTPLIAINGLFRHGYLLAPTLLEQVLAVMDNDALSAPFAAELLSLGT